MKILFYLLFTGLSLFAIAQKEEKIKESPDKLGNYDFNLIAQTTAPAEVKLPFSSIKIIDSRFDTSKLGFVTVEYFVPAPTLIGLQQVISVQKIRINGGITKSIEEYYNGYYKNSFEQNGLQLLIVMKRFWISGIDNSVGTRIDLVTNLKSATNFYCKWEYYLGKDNKYLPVKRMDTIIKAGEVIHSDLSEGFSKSKQEYFKFVLNSLIEILDFEMAVVAYESQPKKTLTEIHSFNIKRINLPVLQDSSIKKGVYLSFDDFIKNKPAIINFVEKKMKYSAVKKELYLETATGELISEYWGYSDGKAFRFGKFSNELIYRQGNTFEFYILMKLTRNNVSSVMGGSQLYLSMPYQLDMETGKAY